MTSPASDEQTCLDLTPVFVMFRRANEALKSAEFACGKFVAPVLNEFRMAFYHVIEAHKDGNASEELLTALRHCQRAYYDAREVEVLAKLQIIVDFDRACSGHQDIVKSHILDYANKRNAILEAQASIREAALIHNTREEQYEKYDPHCETLEAYCREILAMQPAISTAIRKQKIKSFWQCVGGIAAIVIAVGAIINWLRS